MNKVEKYKLTKDGSQYLKRVKAIASVKKALEARKKKLDIQAMVLDKALEEVDKGLVQYTQIPGENLTHNNSLQEDENA